MDEADEDVKIRVCRLCFNLISDRTFSPIMGSLRDMLKVITSDLNLDVTDFPVMCKECLDLVQDVFNFKTNCFESEEIIETKLPDTSSKLDLVDIMREPLKRGSTRSFRKKICRTCLQRFKGHFVVINRKSDVTLSQMLESCLSELNLKLTTNPIMCLTCYETLQKMSMFKIMCKENECKIDAFLKTGDTKIFKGVNLHSVLQFSLNVEVNANIVEGLNIKTEPKCERLEESRVPNCGDYVMVKIEPKEEVEESTWKSGDENDASSDASKPENESESDDKKVKRRGRGRPKGSLNKATCCAECGYRTRFKYKLKLHVVMSHRKKEARRSPKRFYRCSHCRFTTRWQLDLTRHLLSHVKPEAYQCTRCPYSTNKNGHLIKHILSHVNADSLDKSKLLQASSQVVL